MSSRSSFKVQPDRRGKRGIFSASSPRTSKNYGWRRRGCSSDDKVLIRGGRVGGVSLSLYFRAPSGFRNQDARLEPDRCGERSRKKAQLRTPLEDLRGLC